MIPANMLDQAGDQHRLQFFHLAENEAGEKEWRLKLSRTKISSSTSNDPKDKPIIPSTDPIKSLSEVIGAETSKKKKHQPPTDAGQAQATYELFVDLIYRMLAYDPRIRISPEQALQHPFIASGDGSASARRPAAAPASTPAAAQAGPPASAEGPSGDSRPSANTSTDMAT